jgi:hypothetical protein
MGVRIDETRHDNGITEIQRIGLAAGHDALDLAALANFQYAPPFDEDRAVTNAA